VEKIVFGAIKDRTSYWRIFFLPPHSAFLLLFDTLLCSKILTFLVSTPKNPVFGKLFCSPESSLMNLQQRLLPERRPEISAYRSTLKQLSLVTRFSGDLWMNLMLE